MHDFLGSVAKDHDLQMAWCRFAIVVDGYKVLIDLGHTKGVVVDEHTRACATALVHIEWRGEIVPLHPEHAEVEMTGNDLAEFMYAIRDGYDPVEWWNQLRHEQRAADARRALDDLSG